ncbi:hypothetical protein FA13DRAFT_1819575 [Coprinellus micaceus]|uniref:Uncharacterized protein n=1 Tax=Coprinellus micaceus TaxID=71717 RepID=A0A4Y7SIH7_COPMI|nr:hypothetical protein FA13DRAFT_1819575 [Coprinellus micaceus]
MTALSTLLAQATPSINLPPGFFTQSPFRPGELLPAPQYRVGPGAYGGPVPLLPFAFSDGDFSLEAQRARNWREQIESTFLGGGLAKDEDLPDLDAVFTDIEHSELGVESLTVRFRRTISSLSLVAVRALALPPTGCHFLTCEFCFCFSHNNELIVLRRLTIPPIQYSILHKVLNAVAALDPTKVPRDSEFNFRGRDGVLYGRLQAAIDAGIKHISACGEDDMNASVSVSTHAKGDGQD